MLPVQAPPGNARLRDNDAIAASGEGIKRRLFVVEIQRTANLDRAFNAARQQIGFRIQIAPDDPWLIVAVDQFDASPNTVGDRVAARVPSLLSSAA